MKAATIATGLLAVFGVSPFAEAGPVTLPLTARRVPRRINGERSTSLLSRRYGGSGKVVQVPIKDWINGTDLQVSLSRDGILGCALTGKTVVQRDKRRYAAAMLVRFVTSWTLE